MESIWWRRRYEGKDENEGGGASRVKINKLVQGLKVGISEKSEPDFRMPPAAFFIIIIFACMNCAVAKWITDLCNKLKATNTIF